MIEGLKLVQGMGDKGREYPSCIGGVKLREYCLWKSMLSRCSETFWIKNPTYIGTTCSENFKSYTFFYEWCQEQTGFNSVDENGKFWHLDKDILFKGNKFYNENNCLFVPQRVNTLMVREGISFLGVGWHKGKSKFRAYCSNGSGSQVHLGYFNSQQHASRAYKTFKEALIKGVANQHKDQLDPRAYSALMNYQVTENN